MKDSQRKAIFAKKSKWNQLVSEQGKQMVERTPKGLLTALEGKNPKGWMQRGYVNGISKIRTDGDMIVIHTERGGKYPAGGVYFVNKNNKNQALGDF